MKEIGTKLKAAREAKGIALRTVCDQTHISLRYLEALENGDFAEIPGEVYLKGFLRRYAESLDLDGASVVAEYLRVKEARAAAEREARAAAPGGERQGHRTRKPGRGSTMAGRGRALALIVAIAVAVVATGWGLVIWFYRPAPLRGQPVESAAKPAAPVENPQTPTTNTQPPAADGSGQKANPARQGTVSLATGSTGTTAPAAAAQATQGVPGQKTAGQQAATQPGAHDGGATASPVTGKVRVAVTASGQCWVRVYADGKFVFEGELAAGQTAAWGGAQNVQVRFGNPPVVKVNWNGKEVSLPEKNPTDRYFTAENVATPAPGQ